MGSRTTFALWTYSLIKAKRDETMESLAQARVRRAETSARLRELEHQARGDDPVGWSSSYANLDHAREEAKRQNKIVANLTGRLSEIDECADWYLENFLAGNVTNGDIFRWVGE